MQLLTPERPENETPDATQGGADPALLDCRPGREPDIATLAQRLPKLGPVLFAASSIPTWPCAAPPTGAPWPQSPRLLELLCARGMSAEFALDSDGLVEVIWALDRRGLPCSAIALLPDSDYVAWERLLTHLPRRSAWPAPAVFDCRARRWMRPALQWMASPQRFVESRRGEQHLLGSEPCPTLSRVGGEQAHAIARRFGWRLASTLSKGTQ